MKNHFSGIQLRDHFLCSDIIDNHRLACNNLCNDLTICLINIQSVVVTQEIKHFDQLHISSCRRHPVVLYDFASKLFYDFRKTLESDVDNLWFLREKCTKLLGWNSFRSVHNFFYTYFLFRLHKIPSDSADRRTACQFIIFADNHTYLS